MVGKLEMYGESSPLRAEVCVQLESAGLGPLPQFVQASLFTRRKAQPHSLHLLTIPLRQGPHGSLLYFPMSWSSAALPYHFHSFVGLCTGEARNSGITLPTTLVQIGLLSWIQRTC